jgi:hypothetical protein
MRRLGDMAGEVERGLARLYTATVAAHVDLDINRQGHTGFFGGRVKRVYLAARLGGPNAWGCSRDSPVLRSGRQLL